MAAFFRPRAVTKPQVSPADSTIFPGVREALLHREEDPALQQEKAGSRTCPPWLSQIRN